jgi:hypothetical protein
MASKDKKALQKVQSEQGKREADVRISLSMLLRTPLLTHWVVLITRSLQS